MVNHKNIFQNIAFVLTIVPAFTLGFLILHYSVNVPYADQWAIAPLFPKFSQGQLSFADLIAQHNESRKFFPRLIFIALASLTQWDVRYEMLVIFLLACLVSLNIYRLTQSTIIGIWQTKFIPFFLANLLIFSPIQYGNWLWGIQVVTLMPIACITSAIAFTYTTHNRLLKFVICAILCLISTFSFANGILSWVILFPTLALSKSWKWQDVKNHLNLAIAWLLIFSLNAAVYFYNYQKPPNHPSLMTGLQHPLQAVHFFLAFLGAPLGFDNLNASTAIGCFLFTFFLASLGYLIRFRDNQTLVYQMSGWIAIATYSTISALLTSLGRVGFGVNQALESRYTTFSLYFTVALIHLIPIVFNSLKTTAMALRINPKIRQVLPVAVVSIFLVFHFASSLYGIQQMNLLKADLLQGKACLLWINQIRDIECIVNKNMYPNRFLLKRLANPINDLGWLTPSLMDTNQLAAIQESDRTQLTEVGWFDNLQKTPDNNYVASGWAILPEKKLPADAVILAYEDSQGNSTAFKIAIQRLERTDIVEKFHHSAYLNSGWQKAFFAAEIPAEAVKFNAWAFDSTTGRAYLLNGSYTISK